MAHPLGAELVRGVLDLLFAPACVACRGSIPASAEQRLVCSPCWSRTRAIPAPRCERCDTPFPPGSGPAPSRCAGCEILPPRIRAVRSAFVLEGPVRSVVHALKYRGWRAVATPMAERLARVSLPADALAEANFVVPVPLSAARLRERGYNQAALLAAALAERTGRNVAPDVLRRVRATDRQTTLHPEERRANVAGAFTVRPEWRDRVAGEHILLVDDVWTTGATALACCDALVSAGARIATVLTFARALPDLAP